MRLYDTRDEMIKDLIKPGSRILEVGVFIGEFAKKLYDTRPEHLDLVDPWSGILPSGDQDGNDVRVVDLDSVYPIMKDSLKHCKNITLHRGYSFDVLPNLPDNYYDFIYIDSSHSYEGTKKELLLALHKIKRGGVIALHDYEVNKAKCKNDYNFGVGKAVDEFCQEFFYSIDYKALDGCVSVGIRIAN